MPKLSAVLSGFGCLAISLGLAQNPSGVISIDLKSPGHLIGKGFYGLMTEEVNHSYDGGIYGELIQNRSFRDNPDSPVHWTLTGDGASLSLERGNIPAVRVKTGDKEATLSNGGYWGIPVHPRTTYKLTVRAKAGPDLVGPVRFEIRSADDSSVLASAVIARISADWKTYSVTLKTGAIKSTEETKFTVIVPKSGSLELNYVSLFPPTYKNRPNGNRRDLMSLLSGMNPSFLRLPGGNYLEGDTINSRFEWKDTLGKPMDRVGHQGPWGYRSSDGLGLLEFLDWCEDLKMEPVLAVYAGYSLRGDHVQPGPDLAPFVQDALDEIEYVTGDPSTKWGAVRAKEGHPKPFPLKYIEIGNEDWFDGSKSYEGRFAQFFDAIKTKYPKLQLIATARIDSRKPDLFDEHFYRSARDMAGDSTHYDGYDRKGPKIFVGEWASMEGSPTPTMQAALGDAAWLTGLERNSDVVSMESYAPLFVNVNPGAAQWGTNLIGYDALNSFGSPSYYVQSMFASYTGDVFLPSSVKMQLPDPKPFLAHGAIGLATWRTDSEFKDLEVTENGVTLYHSDFGSANPLIKPARGTWVAHDGAFRQTSDEEGTLAIGGDSNWTNYTYHLKARKLSGAEGFIIPFHVHDDQNFWQWNIGGWDDTRTRIQRIDDGNAEEVGNRSPVTIETNRWYDIKIEVKDNQIKCYLDDQLVSQATETARAEPNPVFVAASERLSNHHILAKIVNYSDQNLSIRVVISGAGENLETATGSVLQGNRGDTNSLSNPTKIVPVALKVPFRNNSVLQFPARSVTVLDIPSP